MNGLLTMAEYSRRLGTSRTWVSKAVAQNHIWIENGKINPEHPINRTFEALTRANTMRRTLRAPRSSESPEAAAARQLVAGRVDPQWLALAVLVDDKRVPLLFMPPVGDPVVVAEPDAWWLNLEAGLARGPGGVEYKLIAVFDGEHPPLELRDGRRAEPGANDKTGGVE